MLSSFFGKTPLHTQLNTNSDQTDKIWNENFPSFIPVFCGMVQQTLVKETLRTRQRYYDVYFSRLNEPGPWRDALVKYTRVAGIVNNKEIVQLREALIKHFTDCEIPLECSEEMDFTGTQSECYLRIRWDNPAPVIPEAPPAPEVEDATPVANDDK